MTPAEAVLHAEKVLLRPEIGELVKENRVLAAENQALRRRIEELEAHDA